MRSSILPGTTLLVQAVLAGATLAGDVQWNQFRGASGAGTVPDSAPPLKIAADRATWHTPVPQGKSSPVLWGNRIFLTGLEGGRLISLAVDRNTGQILWKELAPEVPLEAMHQSNSPAASTPCADAERVCVYFGSFGLLCYDHEGHELWRKPIPTPKSMYGVATSPILHGDLLILILDDDADLPDSKLSRSRVIALDKTTGNPVWETPRPYNRGAWTSPMIWQHDGGTDLVVLGNGRLYGYDPTTGAEQWYVNGFAREPIALPVSGDGLLYVAVSMQGGRGDETLDPEPFWAAMLHFDRDGDGRIARDEITRDFTMPLRPELPVGHSGFGIPLPDDPVQRRQRQNDIFGWRDKDRDGFWTKEEFTADMSVGRGRPTVAAIRPGGHGDVTESHVAWEIHSGVPEIPSPIFHQGRLYLVRDGGVLSCIRATTGEFLYRERLGAPGQYSASPVVANHHLYLGSDRGIVTVVKCGDDFEITGQTDLGEGIAATPAMDRNTLYIRTGTALMAFR
ncbi:MAG: PQQ-binding-like beta-propeller repeat protein [Verrucomicrobiales bacterium]|nr:PQQ-binding-like beta-propeller repeat protein [Verrucomicrobiales bacterium]